VDEFFLGHADPVELHRVDVAVHWRK
jgi:hypothetical protein